jgi:cytochrome c oxidase assembly protein subunit 15
VSKKKLNREWIKKSLFLFLLGGLQGFLGWFMVKSGLTERTSVSHYRLAIHLLAAFITFGFTFWFVLQLLFERREETGHAKTFSLLKYIFIIVILQIIYGEWIPAGISAMTPAYINPFENPVTVQFIHRCLAIAIVILVLVFALRLRKETFSFHQKRSGMICMIAVCVQFILGLLTLLYNVPLTLAALHQTGGFFLFTSVVAALYFFSKPDFKADGNNPLN